MSETQLDPTNKYPRFIFVLGPDPEDFISNFMDIVPEALWLDAMEPVGSCASVLCFKDIDLLDVLRAWNPPQLGVIALDQYREGFDGDENNEQVIISGPLIYRDVFVFSRVYGESECLILSLIPLDQTTDPEVLRIKRVELRAGDQIDMKSCAERIASIKTWSVEG